MADNKAKALKDANYTVKLILGSDPTHEGRVIDISQPIKEALNYEDITSAESLGVAYKIIGLHEVLAEEDFGFDRVEALRTPLSRISLRQDVHRILQASIVNAKQYEAIRQLINGVFDKDRYDEKQGAEYILMKSQ